MGKSTPSAPKAPDPVATANAQAAANKETAIAQAQLNMVDQYTPYGSLTYKQISGGEPTFNQSAYDHALSSYNDALEKYNNGGSSPGWASLGMGRGIYRGGAAATAPTAPDPNSFYSSTGDVPRYAATQTLSPEQQKLLDLQNQAGAQYGQTANNQLSQVSGALSTPLDFSTLGSYDDARQKSLDSTLARLQPQSDRQLSGLQTQLANQGIGYGSDAWKSAMDDYNRGQNDRFLAADQYAGTDAMTQRNQAINEMVQQRQIPLNELSAMMSGTQVQQPTYVSTPQTQVGQTPLADSIYGSYNGQMNAYNAQLQNNAANTSGLFGLLGAGAGAFGDINPFGWGK